MENIFITKKLYKELSKKSINVLLGKVLKRIEVIEDREALKASVKELVYEHYRDFLFNIEAISKEIAKYRVQFVKHDRPEK